VTDQSVGRTERLHPLFLLTGLTGSLRGFAGGYAFIAYLFVSGKGTAALLGAAALLAFVTLSLFIYWRRFEFRVGANEIRIDSGFINRTHRSIPFDRIQDVDITQGPLARLLGLAQVKFETGGSAGEEGVLAAIPLERAEDIRTLIRGRRSIAVETAKLEDEARPPVYAMDSKRLILAGAFNFSLALFAGLFGLTQTMGDVLGFDPFDRDFWRGLFDAGDPIADFLLAHRVAAAIAGAALLVLIGLATGIIRTVVRDFGFRVDRTDAGLRRRRGLLTRTDVTLPVKRAQAGLILTGPMRDRFGWRQLKLESLARDEGSGAHVLAPFANDAEVGAVLAELEWPWPPAQAQWLRVSRAYVWSFVIGISPLIVVTALAALILGATPLMFDDQTGAIVAREFASMLTGASIILALLLLAIGARWLAWRRTSYALDGDRLLVRTGWWRRRTLLLPISRIQSIDIAESFVSRWFGTATLLFGVAGASAVSSHQIPSIPRDRARELRRQLLV